MQQLRRGSKDLIREINESMVLGVIRHEGVASRTLIAERTGLSMAAVSGITSGLIGQGLLEERRTGDSTGGRPPILLALRPEAGYAVGLKIAERQVVGVLTDLEGTVVHTRRAAIMQSGVGALAAAAAAVVGELGPLAGSRPVHGVGVGVAGVVDRRRGVIRHATYSHLTEVDLRGILEETLGMPVVVDNDVNTLVASAHWFGLGRGVDDFVVVSYGRGVGLGMVLGGQVYRGSIGGAGEFGHVKVADSPACECGSAGCLEAVIGESAVAARLTQAIGRRVDLDEGLRLARQGNQDAREVITDAGRVLGRAVGNLVNILNPSLIVFAGEGSRAMDVMMPGIRGELDATVFEGLLDQLELVVEKWDDDAWARGAANLLLGELFQPRLRSGDQHGHLSMTARLRAMTPVRDATQPGDETA